MDSGSDYAVTLSGPDTIHSRGEHFQLTMTVDPALPASDYIFVWEAGPSFECVPEPPCNFKSEVPVATVVAPGQFAATHARADYRTIHLNVYFGDVPFSHRVTIGQRAVELDLSCSPWTQPFDPCDDVPFTREDTIFLHTRMEDAREYPIVEKIEYAFARGRIFSRDSTVATPYPLGADKDGVLWVKPIRAGTTWVVLQVDDAVDSIRVAVAP